MGGRALVCVHQIYFEYLLGTEYSSWFFWETQGYRSLLLLSRHLHCI